MGLAQEEGDDGKDDDEEEDVVRSLHVGARIAGIRRANIARYGIFMKARL
jgi:hypothetical protein